MSRDSFRTELRGFDDWITREPPCYGPDPDDDAIEDNRPGVLSSIIKAIDAYTAKDGIELDLSAKSGWHRNYLAMAIADALAADGHTDPDT